MDSGFMIIIEGQIAQAHRLRFPPRPSPSLRVSNLRGISDFPVVNNFLRHKILAVGKVEQMFLNFGDKKMLFFQR